MSVIDEIGAAFGRGGSEPSKTLYRGKVDCLVDAESAVGVLAWAAYNRQAEPAITIGDQAANPRRARSHCAATRRARDSATITGFSEPSRSMTCLVVS